MYSFVSSTPLGNLAAKQANVRRSSFCSNRARRSSQARAQRCIFRNAPTMASESAEPLVVMVNGLPGRMAAATAEEVVRRGIKLAEEAMTGPGMNDVEIVAGKHKVNLQPPSEHEACLERMRSRHSRLVIVDYTHPSAANKNVDLYVAKGISFVIGTTGGDAKTMHMAVMSNTDVCAVIAPNMAKQIVAFQAMMEIMGKEFPGVFNDYSLTVKESHQAQKADTSGTAKAVVASFTDMGVDFSVDRIERVRESTRSVEEMQVPPAYVEAGHAFHTYHLSSPDNTVHFEFQHNVCGRAVYAAGTVDAVLFVDARLQAGDLGEKRVFTMIDILRSGTMSSC